MSAVLKTDIVSCARSWLGTPYQHQASCKQYGTDCLGLLRGIWREIYGAEPLSVPPYTPDWAEQSGQETLYEAAAAVLREIDIAEARPGDVLLFRMAVGAPAKHAAILSGEDEIIHAYWGRAVTRSFIAPFWIKRRAFAFSFPGAK